LAFYLFDVFDAAMNEISASNGDPRAMLAELKELEDEDYEILLHSETPKYFEKFGPGSEETRVINTTLYGIEPNFCHTAKLPAEIRHKGILTESSQTGFLTCDKGMSRHSADDTANDSELMRLVYDEDERYDCPVATLLDFKDYFYLHQREEWKKLILPNDAELKEYGSPDHVLKGMILMCFKLCDWGNCPTGTIVTSDFDEGKFQMLVNGDKVTGLIPSKDCMILTNSEGNLFQPNVDGKFEIMAKVVEPNFFMRISAFIIW
jgi:hypothetical protein